MSERIPLPDNLQGIARAKLPPSYEAAVESDDPRTLAALAAAKRAIVGTLVTADPVTDAGRPTPIKMEVGV